MHLYQLGRTGARTPRAYRDHSSEPLAVGFGEAEVSKPRRARLAMAERSAPAGQDEPPPATSGSVAEGQVLASAPGRASRDPAR